MNSPTKKIYTIVLSICLSLAVHLLALISMGRFGSYSFAAPVNQPQAVMVDLTKNRTDTAALVEPGSSKITPENDVEEREAEDSDDERLQEQEPVPPPEVAEKIPAEAKKDEPAVIEKEKVNPKLSSGEPVMALQQPPVRHGVAPPAPAPPPLRTVGEFISSRRERLSYLVSLRGIPVGNMELEAINEPGEVRISLRTKSNTALSSLYSVDNIMETRLLGGNFIVSKIRQHEGSFNSDIGFTIFLRDKRVFWIDRLRKRYSEETIPNSDVLDTLSSFYYLRNRPLQIGKTELLHIYDGDVYAPVPIEVLRQEEIRLRNLKKVDSLVVRHVRQKGGIFRRTGDMLVWLTNDGSKVPVRIETSTSLGKVTLELVSAETEQFDKPETQNSSR